MASLPGSFSSPGVFWDAFFPDFHLAEVNRSPFDIPEAESELIAGHMTEYSGFKYAVFFLAEFNGYVRHVRLNRHPLLGWVSCPATCAEHHSRACLAFSKLMLLVLLFIWIRGTMPRLRADQLMEFAWKFMLPMSVINLVSTGIWIALDGGLLQDGSSPVPVTSALTLA